MHTRLRISVRFVCLVSQSHRKPTVSRGQDNFKPATTDQKRCLRGDQFGVFQHLPAPLLSFLFVSSAILRGEFTCTDLIQQAHPPCCPTATSSFSNRFNHEESADFTDSQTDDIQCTINFYLRFQICSVSTAVYATPEVLFRQPEEIRQNFNLVCFRRQP